VKQTSFHTLVRLRRPTTLAAIVLAAGGLVFAVGGVRLGLWEDNGPGPGLVPSLAAILMLGLIAALVVGRAEAEEPFRREPILAIALCFAFAVLAPRVGVVIPGVLMIAIWVKSLHGQTWLRAFALGIGLVAAGIGMFHILLKVPMTLIVGLP
jgi:hypothetical protein